MLKARFFLTVFSPAVMPAFIYTGYLAESMKWGMLMKSKHSTYGKKITSGNTQSNCGNYHNTDIFCYRCKVTAPLPKLRLLNKS